MMKDNVLQTKIEGIFSVDFKTFLKYFVPIVLVAIFFRYFMIDLKPPHHDEGVNGWFIMQMWQNGFYNYDPQNYHGPLYFYLLQLFEIVFGKGIIGMRFITALVSLASVVLILMHYRFFGKVALWAGLVMAISPAMVYYARYAIHESLLITFQVLFSYGYFLHHFKVNSKAGIICMIAGFFGGLMVKETFFIFYGCWGIGVLAMHFVSKDFPTKSLSTEAEIPPGKNKLDINFIIFWVLIFFAISIVFFTGFLMDMQGAKDMFAAFFKWADTGTKQTGHDKPFFYWLEVMQVYEWIVLYGGVAGLAVLAFIYKKFRIWGIISAVLVVAYMFSFNYKITFLYNYHKIILLAVLGIGYLPIFLFSSRYCRLILMVGIGLFFGYSFIPYKTPWIIMNILWPFFFVFGYMIEMGREKLPVNVGYIIVLIALTAIITNSVKMVDIVFKNNAHPDEKYVYTHTDITMNYFFDHLEDAVDKHPELKNMDVKVYIQQTWPLPWVFGDWPRTSYSGMPSISRVDGDVFLVDKSDEDAFDSKIQEPFIKIQGKLRGAYTDILFYYKYRLFKDSWQENYKEKKTIVNPKAK